MSNGKITKKSKPANVNGGSAPRIGLALGGGGPIGGIYEIGALRALDEVLEGLDFNDLDVYVGVNSGSFVAAHLVNQVTTAQLCRIFVRNESELHPFHPGVFYRPAFAEMGRRMLAIPGLVTTALTRFFHNPYDQSLLEALTILAQAAPAGLFNNEGLHHYLRRAFRMLGRTNDFRQLKRQLFIVAADIESSKAVCFGAPGFDTVPISKAIQASTASAGIYVPVEIEGRYYVDGTLRKGLHASVAFDHHADLVLAINPQVPLDATAAMKAGTLAAGEMTRSGMPNVLAQAYRTMMHSRMQSGIDRYAQDYPDKDIVVFEPSSDDAILFGSNVFSFESRRLLCEHAYQATRRDLRLRAAELEPKLAKYGIALRHDYLNDTERTVSTSLFGEPPQATTKAKSLTQKSRLAAGLQNVIRQPEKAGS
jgi:predicted acylesterase/phospholipase RssA